MTNQRLWDKLLTAGTDRVPIDEAAIPTAPPKPAYISVILTYAMPLGGKPGPLDAVQTRI